MRKSFTALIATLFLIACGNDDPPSIPPEWSDPPEVATSGFITAYTEQEIAMTVPEVRQFIKERTIIENIANPVETEIIRGSWAEPGAGRRVTLADGHYVIERVIENREDFFKYQLFIFTNATGRGVEQIVGEQRFVATETGTRFEWTYNILPKNFLTRYFVRQNLDELQGYLETGLKGFADAANGK